MKALLFFLVVFGIIYATYQTIKESEKKTRNRNLREVQMKSRRASCSVAVKPRNEDETAGFLLMTENLVDSED